MRIAVRRFDPARGAGQRVARHAYAAELSVLGVLQRDLGRRRELRGRRRQGAATSLSTYSWLSWMPQLPTMLKLHHTRLRAKFWPGVANPMGLRSSGRVTTQALISAGIVPAGTVDDARLALNIKCQRVPPQARLKPASSSAS